MYMYTEYSLNKTESMALRNKTDKLGPMQETEEYTFVYVVGLHVPTCTCMHSLSAEKLNCPILMKHILHVVLWAIASKKLCLSLGTWARIPIVVCVSRSICVSVIALAATCLVYWDDIQFLVGFWRFVTSLKLFVWEIWCYLPATIISDSSLFRQKTHKQFLTRLQMVCICSMLTTS